MSTDIRIEKECVYCGSKFVAKTTKTKFCSHQCNSRDYKRRKREEKIAKAKSETKRPDKKPVKPLEEKVFLTVPEAATLLGFSKRTMYRAVKTGNIPAVKVSERGTRIKRTDLNDYLAAEAQIQQEERKRMALSKENYTLTEVRNKYGISDSALYLLIKRHDIPKQQVGKEVVVPKAEIDKFLMPKNNKL